MLERFQGRKQRFSFNIVFQISFIDLLENAQTKSFAWSSFSSDKRWNRINRVGFFRMIFSLNIEEFSLICFEDYWHEMELFSLLPVQNLKMRKSSQQWPVVFLLLINEHVHQVEHQIISLILHRIISLDREIWIWFYLMQRYLNKEKTFLNFVFVLLFFSSIQNGKMAIAAVATQLVCMVSKSTVQLGMLKAKVKNQKHSKENSLTFVFLSNVFRWTHFHHICKNHFVKCLRVTTDD